MNKQEKAGALVVAALAILAAAGCGQKTASAQIRDGFSQFSTARNQAVTLVAQTKRSLDAADVNTLAVSYTDLQEKANAYAGFMVEAVTTSSFDANRNAQYAADLSKAIAKFDKAYAAMLATRQTTTIAGAWVPTFAQGLQTRWDQYNGYIAKMSPQTKADLIKDLKRATVWPNYEDIATEALVGNR
jgi:hypothetical protein